MARASKKERKKAISDIPDLPSGPWQRVFGRWGPAVPLIPILAKEIAKLMIDAERDEMPSSERDEILDHFFGIKMPEDSAITRRRQQEERWAMQERQLLEPRGGKEKPKKKRKVSDYSKQFGIILKALKKKHPRTPVTRLMKRAHTATKKKMPKKKAPGKGRLSKGRRTIAKSGQFRRDKILPRK